MQIDAVLIQINIHLRLALGYLILGGGGAGVPEFRRRRGYLSLGGSSTAWGDLVVMAGSNSATSQ